MRFCVSISHTYVLRAPVTSNAMRLCLVVSSGSFLVVLAVVCHAGWCVMSLLVCVYMHMAVTESRGRQVLLYKHLALALYSLIGILHSDHHHDHHHHHHTPLDGLSQCD